MTDARDWFSAETGRRITAIEMAEALDISRNSVQSRLAKGLSADDLITVARHLGISPIHALVELGYITLDEAWDFFDGDRRLVVQADEGELAIELARRLNPATRAKEIDAIEAGDDLPDPSQFRLAARKSDPRPDDSADL